MNNEVKYEFKGTPAPLYAVDYEGTIQIHACPVYGEKNLLNIGECPEAPLNAALYAASPLLLSALIDLVGTAELLWDEIKPIKDTEIMTATHPVIEEAKRAIEAALNLKTVEK